MKDQLLDVTVVIAAISTSDEHLPYAYTRIYRIDLEERHLESFLKTIELEPGVAHMEKVQAK